MKVKDLMTKKPLTVSPSDTLGKVVRILAEKNISGCPVVSGGKLVGIVTQTDVIRTIDVYEKINKSGDLFSLVVAVLKSAEYDHIKDQLRKVLKIKVKDLSLKTDMTTGSTTPGRSLVRSLNCLQNSMILRPCWPKAGPIGGAGFAWPPFTCSLIFVTSSLAMFEISAISRQLSANG